MVIPVETNSTNHSSASFEPAANNNLDATSSNVQMPNCTQLTELDLMDVFTGMDIGNVEFWGNVSVVWKTFFIIYCVLSYTALLVLFCSCAYLLRYALKQEPFKLRRTLVYLLILHIIWFTFDFVHGILIINSIASGSDRPLANAARTLETIASSSFVNVMIVAPFFHPDSKSHLSLLYAVVFTVIIYSMAMIIVIFSLSMVVGSSATLIILIGCRLLMLILSIELIVLAILYRYSYKTKGPFLLWRDRKLLVIVFPYFLLSSSYFLYMLSTVVSNSNCTENVQLHRAVWLVLNSLLRVCEVSFSIVYFVRAKVFVTNMIRSQSKSENQLPARLGPLLYAKGQESTVETTYYFSPLAKDIAPDPEDSIQEVQKNCKLYKLKLVVTSYSQYVDTRLFKRGSKRSSGPGCIELFPHSTSLLSMLTSQLHNVSQGINSDQLSVIANASTSSGTFDGRAIAIYTYENVLYYCICFDVRICNSEILASMESVNHAVTYLAIRYSYLRT